jgi:catechol 2,3-dioxygenase-like lactoylglutathione lyase family enzyme
MTIETSFHHVAIHCEKKPKTELFFTKILDLHKAKQFSLSPDLSYTIFGIKKKVDIDVYENNSIRIEVYYTETPLEKNFAHICIEINDKNKFLHLCEQYELSPYTIMKDNKEHLFVRDFSENLYEIKEKK